MNQRTRANENDFQILWQLQPRRQVFRDWLLSLSLFNATQSHYFLSFYLSIYMYINIFERQLPLNRTSNMLKCAFVCTFNEQKKEEDKNPINEGKACVSRSECWQSAPVGLIDTLLIVVWLCLLLPLVLLRFHLWFLLLMLMGLCPIASMVRTRLNPVMMTSGPNHCTVNG